MGISHGPAVWKPKKIDIEKNRQAFRRGMRCAQIDKVEGGLFGNVFSKSKNETTTSVTDKYSLTDESKKVYNEYIENIKENIDENVTNSMNKLVTNVMVDVVTKTDNIMNLIATGANVLTISDTEINGEDVIISATQSNKQKVEADMDAQTKVVNEIKQEVSKTLSESIMKQSKDGERLGEEFGKAVNNAVDKAASVAEKYIDTYGETLQKAMTEGAGAFNNTVEQVAGVANNVVDGVLGGSRSTSSTTNTESNIINKSEDTTDITNIKKDINKNTNTVNLENITESVMNNNLKTETLNECKADVKGVNETTFKNLTVNATRLAKLDLTQQNKVKMVVKCVTNTEVVNKIGTEIIEQLESQISKMDLEDGTFEAVGGAIAGSIIAAGEATSTGAKGIGDGVATGAKGVGEGVNSALGGQQFMIAIVLCVIAYVFISMQGGGGMGGGGRY
ncbi:MAG: hypothetical protein CL842_05485 [Crocinitomicaceae bacterium]|nr:hypothetical protein [Crocinitomicaceae bacterium]|tara:strand:+ start:1993 stop:3339 length:1347 start_codon:yes stop_codon:yes gene_type:complete